MANGLVEAIIYLLLLTNRLWFWTSIKMGGAFTGLFVA